MLFFFLFLKFFFLSVRGIASNAGFILDSSLNNQQTLRLLILSPTISSFHLFSPPSPDRDYLDCYNEFLMISLFTHTNSFLYNQQNKVLETQTRFYFLYLKIYPWFPVTQSIRYKSLTWLQCLAWSDSCFLSTVQIHLTLPVPKF